MSSYKFVTKKEIIPVEPQYEIIIEEVSLSQYVGNMIRLKREKLGLNYIDMVKMSLSSTVKSRTKGEGLSSSAIGNVEKGEGNPTLNTLEIICDVLNMHISELFPVTEEEVIEELNQE